MAASPTRISGWDLLTLLIPAAVVVAHISFVMVDGRLPQDPGLYYTDVPDAWSAWLSLDGITLATILAEQGGWYAATIGLALALTDRLPLAMAMFDVVSVALTLLGVGLLARRLGGAPAATAATALAASAPGLVVTGRTSWIHTPETALVVLAAAVWAQDPGLERRRTPALLGILGALVISLRPSGLVWMGLLLPLIAWTGRQQLRRLLAMLVPWAVGVLPLLARLPHYMQAKASARDRYAAQLPALGEQLATNADVWLLGLTAFAALGLLRAPRPRLREIPPPLVLLAASWVAGAIGLWIVFRAGMDNFPLLIPGLALLAGAGLARLHPAAVTLALLAFLLNHIPQWIPSSILHQSPIAAVLRPSALGHHHRNYYRVWQRYSVGEVQALLSAICPSPSERCIIAVDQGLFRPYAEDPGQLELFLMRQDHVQLVDIREGMPRKGTVRYAALVEHRCLGDGEEQWRSRFPESTRLLGEILADEGMLPVWETSLETDCLVMWMTPGGAVPHPEAMPTTGNRPPTPHSAPTPTVVEP